MPCGLSLPVCFSRRLLDGPRESASLLKILRWFELGTSKRWAFRDLFSLLSYLLAGSGMGHGRLSGDPCGWAARLVEADKEAAPGGRPRKETASALYQLVAAQYQHALFHRWDTRAASSVQKDIRELGLHENNATAMGLFYFLQSRTGGYIPKMISLLLDGLVDLLDPAQASPDAEAQAGGGVELGDLDIRFQQVCPRGPRVRGVQALVSPERARPARAPCRSRRAIVSAADTFAEADRRCAPAAGRAGLLVSGNQA